MENISGHEEGVAEVDQQNSTNALYWMEKNLKSLTKRRQQNVQLDILEDSWAQMLTDMLNPSPSWGLMVGSTS